MSMRNEPSRDPELERALRRLEREPAWSDLDAEQMRRAILTRAEGPLARLRRRGTATWWEVVGGWARAAVPLAAAAAIALLFALPRDFDSTESSAGTWIADRTGIAMVVTGEVRERDAVDALLAPAGDEWVPSESGEAEP
jgi:hypothetical protein